MATARASFLQFISLSCDHVHEIVNALQVVRAQNETWTISANICWSGSEI